MTLKKNLGKRIKFLRKQKRMTQEVFSELIKIEQNSLSRIENGNNYPSPETLMAIAKELNVEVYELFVFGEELSYEKMKQEIINALEEKRNIIYLYKALKKE